MSFAKAFQKRATIEGQQEYIDAHRLYRAQCSVAARLRSRLKGKTGLHAELLRFRQEKEFSQQCKIYFAAKDKWDAQQTMAGLKEKGITEKQLSAKDLARLIDIPLMNDKESIYNMVKKETAMREAPAEFEELIKHAKAHLTEKYGEETASGAHSESLKEQFLAQAEDEEFVRDFSDEHAAEPVEEKVVIQGNGFSLGFKDSTSEDPTLGDFDPI